MGPGPLEGAGPSCRALGFLCHPQLTSWGTVKDIGGQETWVQSRVRRASSPVRGTLVSAPRSGVVGHQGPSSVSYELRTLGGGGGGLSPQASLGSPRWWQRSSDQQVTCTSHTKTPGWFSALGVKGLASPCTPEAGSQGHRLSGLQRGGSNDSSSDSAQDLDGAGSLCRLSQSLSRPGTLPTLGSPDLQALGKPLQSPPPRLPECRVGVQVRPHMPTPTGPEPTTVTLSY